MTPPGDAPAARRDGHRCPDCGSATARDDRFCSSCGTRLHGAGQPVSEHEAAVRGLTLQLAGLVGWVLYGLSFVAAAGGLVQTVGGEFVTAGLYFVLAGLLLVTSIVVNPRFGRTLARRHSVATFGRTKTVDHRVIRPGEHCVEPCVACGERFDAGLVRRRRNEFVLAGIPTVTRSIGYNHYCADCAEREVFGKPDETADALDAVEAPADDDAIDEDSPPRGFEEAHLEEQE